jgi:oxygen-independent coproporphyrinogen-3 oxidase
MDQSVKFDLDLINRYDKSGPRYTSYPTALELHDSFTEQDYLQQLNYRISGVALYRCIFTFLFAIPFAITVPVIKLSPKTEIMQNPI